MAETAPANQDNIKLAVSAIVFAVFTLSLGDALIKHISVNFTLWQIFVLRSFLAIPVLIAIKTAHAQAFSLLPRQLGWTALRSLMLTIMWLAYYAALPHLSFSVAAAVYYTLPIFIVLFAGLFLGDRVGKKSWIAVTIGFCGMLMMLRPQADDFNPYALLPLASAVLYALAMIITRSKCRNEEPLALSFALNVSFIATGLVASLAIWLWNPSDGVVQTYPQLLGQWTVMGQGEWLAMALLAAAVIIGSVFSAYAYQSGPSSIVGTFDFAYLAFAVVWGMLFFGEFPDAIAIAGMVLIASAGIITVRR